MGPVGQQLCSSQALRTASLVLLLCSFTRESQVINSNLKSLDGFSGGGSWCRTHQDGSSTIKEPLQHQSLSALMSFMVIWGFQPFPNINSYFLLFALQFPSRSPVDPPEKSQINDKNTQIQTYRASFLGFSQRPTNRWFFLLPLPQ